MMDRLCIRVCAHFARDIGLALEALGVSGIRLDVYPATCTGSPGRCDRAMHGDPPSREGEEVLVIAGGEPDTPARRPSEGVHSVRLGHCLELLVGADVLHAEVRAGAHLVTAGWLGDWQRHLQDLGFDRETAGRFFHECTRELLLLDTGSDPSAANALTEMGDYLGLPCRSRFVGLDHLKLVLDDAIGRRRLAATEARAREVAADANRKVANYAMAFDLLVRLSHLTREENTIAAIQELFEVLFGCTNLVYAQVKDGRVARIFAESEHPDDRIDLQQALDALHEGYLVMPSGNGFYLRIDYHDEVVGLILVREIPFPAYRDQYLNLGLAVAELCGLAISNARTFVMLQETERSLRRERDINARLLREVRTLPAIDPLTGCDNPERFSERAGIALVGAARSGLPSALILLEVDHFQQIMEIHGTAIGDRILEEIGRRLRGARVSDLLARYGADQLLAFCPGTDTREARRIAERLRLDLHETPIETADGPIRITASVGVATLEPELASLDALVDRADQALERAKTSGRDRLVVADRNGPV